MKNSIKILIIFMCSLSLAACNHTYDSEKAAKRGDIVDIHGRVTNADRLELFINNIKDKQEDKIRITNYTIEGDPIYYDLTYNGETIKYKYDNSQDKFGSSNVISIVCKNLLKTDEANKITYQLEGCSGKNADFGNAFIYSINKN